MAHHDVPRCATWWTCGPNSTWSSARAPASGTCRSSRTGLDDGASTRTRTAKSGPPPACPTSRCASRERQVAYQKRTRSACSATREVEVEKAERVVLENEHFVVVVPFWAVWPFETLVLPRRHVHSVGRVTPAERDGFADALKRLTCRYDNIFEVSFPTPWASTSAHDDAAPGVAPARALLPSAPALRDVRKFMWARDAGGRQRDITPRPPRSALRELPEVHYRIVRSRIWLLRSPSGRRKRQPAGRPFRDDPVRRTRRAARCSHS